MAWKIAGVDVHPRARCEDFRRALRLVLDEPVEQFLGRRRRTVLLQYRCRTQQRRNRILAALNLRI